MSILEEVAKVDQLGKSYIPDIERGGKKYYVAREKYANPRDSLPILKGKTSLEV